MWEFGGSSAPGVAWRRPGRAFRGPALRSCTHSLAARADLAGALALCAGEALLPVQGCVACLGPRLKAAALQGILRLCTQAMQRG